MTMSIPQYEMILQPLSEFVADHRKDIDDVIHKQAAQPPAQLLRFPISDELREHVVINNRGTVGLYAEWRKTAKPRRVL